MNAIQNAIKDIKFTIPIEVLQVAFTEVDNRLNNFISLDERILASIIRPRVIIDTNIVGGIEARIDLNRCNISSMTNREFIVEVPKTLTNGTSIMSVLGIVSNVVYSQTTAYSSTTPLESAAINMMNNLGTENVVQTSRLELISDNIVLVADPTIHLMNGVLRAVLENSANMSNLNPRSFNAFSKLCILAVKAYVYNIMVIKMDKAAIWNGHELGSIKDVIDSYSDAEEQYQEYLTTIFRKVQFVNDSDKMSRYVSSMISNTI